MDEPTEAKRCTRCEVVKPVEQFQRKGKSRLHSYCKECMREYQRGRPRVKAARKIAIAAKKAPCADCGESYPPYVMDFDHRPGTTKLAGIAILVKQGASTEVILAEIAKCEVVCANCHRIRSFKREQQYFYATDLDSMLN